SQVCRQCSRAVTSPYLFPLPLRLSPDPAALSPAVSPAHHGPPRRFRSLRCRKFVLGFYKPYCGRTCDTRISQFVAVTFPRSTAIKTIRDPRFGLADAIGLIIGSRLASARFPQPALSLPILGLTPLLSFLVAHIASGYCP